MKSVSRLLSSTVALALALAAASGSASAVDFNCHWVHTVNPFSCGGSPSLRSAYCYSILPQEYKDFGCCAFADECHDESTPYYYDCIARDAGQCPNS